MTRESWSVAFACLLGAFVGALVALELAARFTYGSYFWGVGALFGGAVAYCVVDFGQLCAGIKRAYKKTIAWKPNWQLMSISSSAILVHICAVVAIATSFIFPTLLLSRHFLLGKAGVAVLGIVSLAYALFGFIWLASVLRVLVNNSNLAYANELRKGGLMMILFGNPIGLSFLAIRKLVRSRRIIGRFFRQVFIYIHSTRRTICFVDATVGATAGYFSGSAIVGAVIGAILGLANYELVSIRWLKLIPQPVRIK